MRSRNTNKHGNAFGVDVINAVWQKAQVVAGTNPAIARKDKYGAWIEYEKYGERVQSGTGWEIDHIQPVSKGGDDYLSNLQPLQWQNNVAKSDAYPYLGNGEVSASR